MLTFGRHFTRTLTRTAGERAWWWPAVTNVAIVAVSTGLASGRPELLASGATLLIVVVFVASRRLRRMRRDAVGARFGWIVRLYERAHGAFLHGAVHGAVMGVGLDGGTWYGATRIAHLHANLLGWGGLTLLATLVLFGPIRRWRAPAARRVRTPLPPGPCNTVRRHSGSRLCCSSSPVWAAAGAPC